MNEHTTALQVLDGQGVSERPPTMIRPLASPTEALEAWQAFQQLKEKLITADDVQKIQGRSFVKKAGWRKIAAAFGISTEAVAEGREEIPGGWLWRVRVRATAPNGRYAEGTAGCASNERRFSHPEHDVYAQAFTRACNRAISDLVGGGEVSAEEMKADDDGDSKELAALKAQVAALQQQLQQAKPQEPSIPREIAEATAHKFLEALAISVVEAPAETGPLWVDVITAVVMARGDLRRAFKALAPTPAASVDVDGE